MASEAARPSRSVDSGGPREPLDRRARRASPTP
jgi:hypothetical protein